jgi:beta-galactosidase
MTRRAWIPLAHDWRFFRGDAAGASDPGFDDSSWQIVSVPHCFNADDTFIPTRGYYRGPAWYRCRLPDGLGHADSVRAALVALGAFAVTSVWLNGIHLGEFMGGFTGFAVDLPPHLRDGSNVLALRVTNEHDPDVLPGKEIPDYNLYGGIYREMGLRVTDALHITERGIVVDTPSVNEGAAQVAVAVAIRNSRRVAARGILRIEVGGPDGSAVARAEAPFDVAAGGETLVSPQLPVVNNPRLWSPDAPNLYYLSTVVTDDSGVVDQDTVAFGLRWYEFDADDGFVLNGMPLKLRGVNRHQDYPGIGNALPAAFQQYDVQLIKQIGGNFVRCSHYPMHPAFLDACDRLGVLVYEEIASWQFIGGERFADNAVTMMEEMIARDRHHPSIILWGLLNEGRDAALFRRLDDTAHRCDPGRLTTYAENNPEDAVALGTAQIPDVLGLNYRTDQLDDLRDVLPGIKLFSSEHTNADAARRGQVEKEVWQMFRVMHDLNQIEAREWMAGSALWSMHDYGTDYGVVWPLQKSGVFDAWRLPKAAAIALRARWTTEPVVHIVGHWNHTGLQCGDSQFKAHLTSALSQFAMSGMGPPGAETAFDAYLTQGWPASVVVISNLDRVELFLNGTSLGERSREQGFVWQVPFQSGVLRAVARTARGEFTHELRTAANPDVTGSVLLETLHSALPANGTDITLITATVVDSEGAPVPDAERPVSFRVFLDGVEGGADILGVGGIPGLVTQGGTGRIVLRAGRQPGVLQVVAECTAVQSGEVSLTLVPA